MKKLSLIKAAFSLILLIAFCGVIFITIGTIISTRQGSFLGLTQLDFLKLRARYGFIMLVLILIHLFMNRSIMKKELQLLFD
ncbi:hypothetical protein [Pyrococcus abyssi]|uniref:DUF4405 domain-containing protein n=1 Tax=Pyrococcus abyssi (strain GE5 / Orsay) TaxID=272844 RepID=G8ZFL3_PYRAB|nr:hypothetical protein [Pyrococcus abyssi]CCE69404.1 TPA: hypothetical protein PAB2330.2n [Pyrococcus abyssi GE5]